MAIAFISFYFNLFFLVRKVGPKLTSVANLPPCLRKIVTELTSVPIFLYFMWDATTAWLEEQRVGPHLGSEPANPGLLKQSTQT